MYSVLFAGGTKASSRSNRKASLSAYRAYELRRDFWSLDVFAVTLNRSAIYVTGFLLFKLSPTYLLEEHSR